MNVLLAPPQWLVNSHVFCMSHRWEARLKSLREFKEKFGHCIVPKEYPENMVRLAGSVGCIACFLSDCLQNVFQSLSRWVVYCRKHYKRKSAGLQHSLSDDKEKQLRDLGFVFNTRTRNVFGSICQRRYQDQWEARLEQLLIFKEKYGHTAVPRRYKPDEGLSSWCLRQVRQN